jgi:hypothetical protein
MSAMTSYVKVIHALEAIDAPYMIVGAFAGLAFGVSRATFDVDILVDLRDADFETLAAQFPLPRYYADPEMMRNSTRMGILFNLIDTELGIKADLVPLTREPGYRMVFDRRVRRVFQDESGVMFEAWCAQPTDIIIGKLKAWAEGRSAKHPADIAVMLAFALSGLSDAPLDMPAIAAAAARLGPDVAALWASLRHSTETQTRERRATYGG